MNDSKGIILCVRNNIIGQQDLNKEKNDNINFYVVKEFSEIDFLSKVKSWFNV